MIQGLVCLILSARQDEATFQFGGAEADADPGE